MTNDDENLPERHRLIDSSLRRVFQEKLDEDLPDRFKEMLNRLREAGESETGNHE